MTNSEPPKVHDRRHSPDLREERAENSGVNSHFAAEIGGIHRKIGGISRGILRGIGGL